MFLSLLLPFKLFILLEMFYLNSALSFGILPLLVLQLEVYYKVDRLQTGITAQKRTDAQWYSHKTSLFVLSFNFYVIHALSYNTKIMHMYILKLPSSVYTSAK